MTTLAALDEAALFDAAPFEAALMEPEGDFVRDVELLDADVVVGATVVTTFALVTA